MKQIVAIVKPFVADKVIASVASLGVEDILVREVKGFSRRQNWIDRDRGDGFANAFVAKVEIAIWVQDDRADSVVDTISEVSRTGRMGDGKIMILDVDQPGNEND